MQKSTAEDRIIFPPSYPANPTVNNPCFFACSKATSTLVELPLVENPRAISPGRPKAITWRA